MTEPTKTSRELTEALDDLYETLAVPQRVDGHAWYDADDEAVARRLKRTRRREVSAADIRYLFLNNCDSEQSLKYYLPRAIDLIVRGEQYIDTFFISMKIRQARVDRWPDAERDALVRVLQAAQPTAVGTPLADLVRALDWLLPPETPPPAAPLPDDLRLAIDRLYDALRVSRHLDWQLSPVADDNVEALLIRSRLLRTNRHEIHPADLAFIFWNDAHRPSNVKYYLPRALELLLTGQLNEGYPVVAALRRAMPITWPDNERRALRQVFDALEAHFEHPNVLTLLALLDDLPAIIRLREP